MGIESRSRKPMKVLVVSGPHAFATRDVWTGHVAGLREVLGEENVITYDIIPRYNVFHKWTQWLEGELGNVPRPVRANILAAEPIFGAAHFHKVNAVYFVSPMYVPMTLVEMLGDDGFQTWAYFTECPYEDEFWSRAQSAKFTHCFVNDKNSVTTFRAYNPHTHYLPHAYNPIHHWPRWGQVTRWAGQPNNHQHVIFVGTDFASRRKLFTKTNWTGIDFRLYGNWQEVKRRNKLFPHVRHRLVDNHTTAQLYRGSVIGISLHRQERYWEADDIIDPGEAYSLGPRTFELAACGLYQISDGQRPELAEIFGGTIPTFESPKELEREVRWALENPIERQKLAVQQWACVRNHTMKDRMTTLLECVT